MHLAYFPWNLEHATRYTQFVRLRSALALGTRAGPLGAEEEARPVVRVVEQLKLELVALDSPHRQRVCVLALGGAARALVVPLGQLPALGRVLGLNALEPVERLEVGVLREQVSVRVRVRVRVRVGVRVRVNKLVVPSKRAILGLGPSGEI